MEMFKHDQYALMSNIVEGEELQQRIKDVCTIIRKTLEEHNGPASRFAAIHYRHQDTGELVTNFSKDGLGILRAIEFANPLDAGIHTMITSIAEGVESKAGDGTTSATLISLHLRDLLSDTPLAKEPYAILRDVFETVTEDHLDWLRKQAITATDEDNELRWALAYAQAYTSSHGDNELAKMVADLVVKLPTRALEHMVFRTDKLEGAKRFRVEVSDADWEHAGIFANPKMSSGTLGDQTIIENAELWICGEEITANSDVVTEIHDKVLALTEIPEEERVPVVFLLTADNGVVVNELCMMWPQLLEKGVDFRVITTPPAKIKSSGMIHGLIALAGENPRNPSLLLTVATGVEIEVIAGRVKVKNLLRLDERGHNVDLDNPKAAIYKFLESLNANIGLLEQETPSRRTAEQINELHEVAKQVEFTRHGMIVIGGSRYQALAARAVLEDVLKAVRSTLRSGALPPMFIGLMTEESPYVDLKDEGLLENMIARAIMKFQKNLLDQTGMSVDFNPSFAAVPNVLTRSSYEFTQSTFLNQDPTLPIQSLESYEEILRRICDMVPYLVQVQKMLVPRVLKT